MKLPNAERAIVDSGKVTNYLLNAGHPDNGGKARFFVGLGFALSDPVRLIGALRAIAVAGDMVQQVDSPHGPLYVVDGPVESPGGKRPIVRTVWIVDTGQDLPRLVTAYPHEE